jgi:serine phosphatase RsbU (regulator of sigma subunit)
VETANAKGEFFGLDRLRGHLQSKIDAPRSLTDSLYRAIAQHQAMDKLDDDVTFVALRMGPIQPPPPSSTG